MVNEKRKLEGNFGGMLIWPPIKIPNIYPTLKFIEGWKKNQEIERKVIVILIYAICANFSYVMQSTGQSSPNEIHSPPPYHVARVLSHRNP